MPGEEMGSEFLPELIRRIRDAEKGYGFGAAIVENRVGHGYAITVRAADTPRFDPIPGAAVQMNDKRSLLRWSANDHIL